MVATAKHEFCDDCPGCRPAILDVQTGMPMGKNTPQMVEINRIWDEETTYDQRKEFIEFSMQTENPLPPSPAAMQFLQKASEVIQKWQR